MRQDRADRLILQALENIREEYYDSLNIGTQINYHGGLQVILDNPQILEGYSERVIANERRFTFGFGCQLQRQLELGHYHTLMVDSEPSKMLGMDADLVNNIANNYGEHFRVNGAYFPDLVVHGGQGTMLSQCIAIEIKRGDGVDPRRILRDLIKLDLYSTQIVYSFTYFVLYSDAQMDVSALFNVDYLQEWLRGCAGAQLRIVAKEMGEDAIMYTPQDLIIA